MEFLRLGSSIPGSYWGCCACDIIQDFNQDPDEPASIQLVEGDGGTTLGKFAGKTYKDIFLQRLVYGTFSADKSRAVNHAFIAILSVSQTSSTIGKKWMTLLKEQGFEFVRTVNNSVWNKNNYIFMLVRNVGPNAIKNQFEPPQFWQDLPTVVPEAATVFDTDPTNTLRAATGQAMTEYIKAAQKPLYAALPKGTFYTEAQLKAEGVPITYAGKRSYTGHMPKFFAVGYPQQSETDRTRFEAEFAAMTGKEKKETVSLRAPTALATMPVQG